MISLLKTIVLIKSFKSFWRIIIVSSILILIPILSNDLIVFMIIDWNFGRSMRLVETLILIRIRVHHVLGLHSTKVVFWLGIWRREILRLKILNINWIIIAVKLIILVKFISLGIVSLSGLVMIFLIIIRLISILIIRLISILIIRLFIFTISKI